MASDNKKAKADPAPKSEAAAKDKSTSGEAASKAEGAAKDKSPPAAKDKSTPAEGAPKIEGGETPAAAPSNYSRGEGQKPVSAAYRENWNAIFSKKKAKKKSR